MIEKILTTPYSARETAGWFARNIFGISRKNRGRVNYFKSPHIFNELTSVICKIAFIGDIMPMWGGRFKVEESLKKFVGDADYLVGSLDGVISGKRMPIVPFSLNQRHTTDIAADLSGLFPEDKTFLCAATNHSGDFGAVEYFNSIKYLRSSGFNVFGSVDGPFIDINKEMRLIAGTMWSNRQKTEASSIRHSTDFIKKGAYNVLCPHMGYELELFPRPEIIELSEKLAADFDIIAATHPHCPQPVSYFNIDGVNKPVIYSLGDFCTGLIFNNMRHGLVLKIEIGREASGRLAAGRAEWQYTECVKLPSGSFLVRLNKRHDIFA